MREDKLEPLFLMLIYGAVPALIVITLWIQRRVQRSLAKGKGLDHIARGMVGEVATDPAFDRPFVRFARQGIPSFCYQWTNGAGSLNVITTIEGRVGFPGFLEATSQKSLRYPSDSRRFREIPGRAGYQIVTTDSAWAESLLAGALMPILSDLQAWTPRPVRVRLSPDRYIIEVEKRLENTEVAGLVPFMDRLIELSRQVQQAVGIAFIGKLHARPEGRCAVCGQSLVGATVICGSCRTPHHADCWDYWGKCAIFGCGGRRFA